MKISLTILKASLVISVLSLSVPVNAATLKGHVSESGTREPLIGAEIYVKSLMWMLRKMTRTLMDCVMPIW